MTFGAASLLLAPVAVDVRRQRRSGSYYGIGHALFDPPPAPDGSGAEARPDDAQRHLRPSMRSRPEPCMTVRAARPHHAEDGRACGSPDAIAPAGVALHRDTGTSSRAPTVIAAPASHGHMTSAAFTRCASSVANAGLDGRPAPSCRACTSASAIGHDPGDEPKKPGMVLFRPDAVREVFALPAASRPPGRAGSSCARRPHSILVIDGDEHLRERRLLQKPFHGEQMQALGPMIGELARGSSPGAAYQRVGAAHSRSSRDPRAGFADSAPRGALAGIQSVPGCREDEGPGPVG